MTVVTTADTSQLYALAARHGLKLHGPLTVNELGLDLDRDSPPSTMDVGGCCHPAPSRGKREGRTRGGCWQCSRIACRPRCRTGAWLTPSSVAYPMLEDSTAMVIQPGSSTPDWVVPQDSEVFAESFATALAALHAVPISAAVDAGDAHPYTDAGPSEGGRRR